jgi:predicted nuclease with TOPRIM domain
MAAMNFSWDVSLGHLLTVGMFTLGGVGAYYADRAKSNRTAEKIDELGKDMKASLNELGAKIAKVDEASSQRISKLEHELHAVQLQLARDYVNGDRLREVKQELMGLIEKIEAVVRDAIATAMKPRRGAP